MQLEASYDPARKTTRWVLEIDDWERARVDLDPFDAAVLRDVDRNAGDDGKPISDVLLGLEILTRRIAEQL